MLLKEIVLFLLCIFQFVQISVSISSLFSLIDLFHLQQPFLFQTIFPIALDDAISLVNPTSDILTKITDAVPSLSETDLQIIQDDTIRVINSAKQELIAGFKSNTVDLVDVNKIQSSLNPIIQNFLGSFDRFLDSDPRLKLPTNQGLSLIIKEDIVPRLNGLSQNIYNNLLGVDPRLNLKTSEYSSLVIKDNLLPWFQSIKEQISNGPLVSSIRNTFSGVSQQVVSSVSQGLDEGVLKPVGGAFSAASSVDVQKLVGDATIPLPSASELNELVFEKIVAPGQAIIENIAPSLDRFVVNFGAGLSKSGAKLSENLQGISEGTAITFERISTRINQFELPKTVNLDSLLDSLPDTSDVSSSVLQEVQAKFQSKISDLSTRFENSQFFVPPDVIRGESWVDQSIKFLKSLKDLKQEDVSQFSSTFASSLDSFKTQALTDPKIQNVQSVLKQVASGELIDELKSNLEVVGSKGSEFGASSKAALDAIATQAIEATNELKSKF